jgi:hypothetical protein
VSIEDRVFALEGQVNTLSNLCCTIAALHPYKSQLLQLMKGHEKTVDAEITAEPYASNYKSGVKKVIDNLEAAISAVVVTTQNNQSKP